MAESFQLFFLLPQLLLHSFVIWCSSWCSSWCMGKASRQPLKGKFRELRALSHTCTIEVITSRWTGPPQTITCFLPHCTFWATQHRNGSQEKTVNTCALKGYPLHRSSVLPMAELVRESFYLFVHNPLEKTKFVTLQWILLNSVENLQPPSLPPFFFPACSEVWIWHHVIWLPPFSSKKAFDKISCRNLFKPVRISFLNLPQHCFG